ncbi:hypothetical protein A3Q56_07731 [Intoshia linei]|uniref:Uncharacterized protein n=1 Tax=Intoshia linei TaxID=1819745 RepID=A0A177ASQ0_9BILA|nr:hypothetical protein A3Q56_07731 [Intoshia linei]
MNNSISRPPNQDSLNNYNIRHSLKSRLDGGFSNCITNSTCRNIYEPNTHYHYSNVNCNILKKNRYAPVYIPQNPLHVNYFKQDYVLNRPRLMQQFGMQALRPNSYFGNFEYPMPYPRQLYRPNEITSYNYFNYDSRIASSYLAPQPINPSMPTNFPQETENSTILKVF